MTRAAGHDRAAAGKRAGAPVKLARVAGDDAHVLDVDAERIGDDLREHGEVPLALRADAGRDAHRAARLDRHARAFVRPDARAFDVARDADADVLCLRRAAAAAPRAGTARSRSISAACSSAGR